MELTLIECLLHARQSIHIVPINSHHRNWLIGGKDDYSHFIDEETEA